MTTAITAQDVGETVVAAMRELYDQLREIVDRGPTDDPSILDELGALTGRIRRRINSARKKAEPAAEPPVEKPAPAAAPANPAPPSAALGGQTAATADAPTVPRHRAVPAPRRTSEVTVRLPRPSAATGGRHRIATARLPLWVYALVILLIVAGIALGTTASPWGFGMAPAGAAVFAAARRWSVHRQVVTTGGQR